MADRCIAGTPIGWGPCSKCGAKSDEGCPYAAAILQARLDAIVEECRNNISGADEDKSRDMLLSTLIALAEGEMQAPFVQQAISKAEVV